MKPPSALWRFFRRWILVSGALLLAGHCPCCGRAGCTTGAGTATALGGVLAGAVTAARIVWGRLGLQWAAQHSPAALEEEMKTLYPHP